MRLILTLFCLVVFALAAVPVQAAWEAPEGTGYHVQQRVVHPGPVSHIDLDAGPGMISWIEAEPATDAGYPMLLVFDPDDDSEEPQISRIEDPYARFVEVGRDYVVFGEHAAVRAYNRTSGNHSLVWMAEGMGTIKSDPRMNGARLAWASTTPEWPFANLTIHQADLDSPEFREAADVFPPSYQAASWTSPFGSCDAQVQPAGTLIAIRPSDGCLGDRSGGIYLFDPDTRELTTITLDNVVMWQADGTRVLWVAYRAGEGRGANLYAYDLATKTARRVTFSEGRETEPSLSGDWVVWADLRSERTPQPRYNLYFQNLDTINEYKLEDTWDLTYGPAHSDGHVAYVDAQGRLVLLRLPTIRELLTVGVGVDYTPQATGAKLTLDLDGESLVDAAWDKDLDGVFDTQNPLTVPLGEVVEGRTAVMGRAVDTTGRVAAVAFTYEEASRFATGMGGSSLFRAKAVVVGDDSDSSVRPIPGLPVTVALLVAAAVILYTTAVRPR